MAQFNGEEPRIAAKIPATIVTGFLGAGKTTLIRHLLGAAEGRRIALIVNEFGDVGVDGAVLEGCGVSDCPETSVAGGATDIVELANGCICCQVADDFIPTLTALIERDAPPDHIVIETSGLALPQPLAQAFQWPEIRTRVRLDGIVAVVDAAAVAEGLFAANPEEVARRRAADPALDHETPLADLFADQVGCADLIILNKIDLLEETAATSVAAGVRARARAGAPILPTARGAIAPRILLGLEAGEDGAARASDRHHHHHDHHHHHHHDHDHDHDHEHDHDAFESCVLSVGEIDDPAAFAERARRVIAAHGLYRLKGFLAVRGKPMRLVLQAAGPRVETYFDRPYKPGETRDGRLVAIGARGLDPAALTDALGPAGAQEDAA